MNFHHRTMNPARPPEGESVLLAAQRNALFVIKHIF